MNVGLRVAQLSIRRNSKTLRPGTGTKCGKTAVSQKKISHIGNELNMARRASDEGWHAVNTDLPKTFFSTVLGTGTQNLLINSQPMPYFAFLFEYNCTLNSVLQKFSTCTWYSTVVQA